jgi:hypothetical protein
MDEHDRTSCEPVDSIRKKEEVSEKRVEGPDIPRVTKRCHDSLTMAARDEFFDG